MNFWQRIFDFLVARLPLFARTFGKAGALAYAGELVAHALVLATPFRLVDLPAWADWAFVLLCGYCVVFLWVFRSAMVPRFGDPEVRVLVTAFLTISVGLHAYFIVVQNHEALRPLARGFSAFGVVYSLFLVLRLWTLETRITVGAPRLPAGLAGAR